jgi:hypothetical protein
MHGWYYESNHTWSTKYPNEAIEIKYADCICEWLNIAYVLKMIKLRFQEGP